MAARGDRTQMRIAWALEWNTICQAELVAMFRGRYGGLPCLFGDLAELCTPEWRKRCGYDKGRELKPSELFAMSMPTMDVKLTQGRCRSHNRCLHELVPTDMHVSGTTCVDHSCFGKCSQQDGANIKYFFMWASVMNKLLPRVVLHENVGNFGTAGLKETIGHNYIIAADVSSAEELGWPIRRSRQMCVLIQRSWIFAQLQRCGKEELCTDPSG